MNLKLNIEEDQELRLFIKNAIKGQVTSIIREELLEVFRDELGRKVKGMDTYIFNRMMKEAMIIAADRLYNKEMNGQTMRTDIITPIVTAKVNQSIAVKDWDKLIDDLATKKIQDLLKK